MPLSRYLAEKGNALEFNLCVFEGKDDWSDEVRERLIEESIQVLDDLTLDPVLSFSLQVAYETAREPDDSIKKVLAGGEALNSFLESEKFLLESSGFQAGTVDSVVGLVRENLEAGLSGLVPPSDVFKAIVRLKFALIEAKEGKRPFRWHHVALKLALGFSGASLIGLNASGLALTVGIFGPLTALSSAVGGIILGESGKGALELISR